MILDVGNFNFIIFGLSQNSFQLPDARILTAVHNLGI
jgi:hypothetical protein